MLLLVSRSTHSFHFTFISFSQNLLKVPFITHLFLSLSLIFTSSFSMGCSVSRFDTLLAKAIEDPSFSSNTSSSSSSSSTNFSSFPKSRSLSAPLVHHPPLCKGDSNHLVCLTSSSYGSLVVVDKCPSPEKQKQVSFHSKSSPDSVINTWELMEGLEGVDEFNPIDGNGLKITSFDDYVDVLKNSCDFIDAQKKPSSKMGVHVNDYADVLRNSCDFIDAQEKPSSKMGVHVNDYVDVLRNSCDFNDAQKKPSSKMGLNVNDYVDVLRNSCDFNDAQKKPSSGFGLNLSDSFVIVEMPKEIVEEGELNKVSNSKPLWKHLSEESLLSKMDPNVVSSYQKALSTRKFGCDEPKLMSKLVCSTPNDTEIKGYNPLFSKSSSDNACDLPGCEDKIVFYYTSLRGIRRTYEDCCAVRMILRGFRVVVDERDISMDSNYKKELQSALGGKVVSLPQLFIRGRHIGGADEIKQLHENGELERFLDGFPIQDRCFACERCGESRFIPCLTCNGSRKVFQEEEGRTRKCPDCNENGLVRCPACC